MCGRFALFATATEITQQFRVETATEITPLYNIAPSQQILVVKSEETSERAPYTMKWGLIPRWVKDLGNWKSNLINARAETVNEKPSFKTAFRQRPCLIPASGFYEWTENKQPYFFSLEDSPVLALAGIWESWNNGEEELLTCAIITTEANSEASQVHHRMPVIINPNDYDRWLLGSREERQKLLVPFQNQLELYPVSKQINNPRFDEPICVKSVA